MKNFRGLPRQAVVLAVLCASLTAFANTALAQEGVFVPTGIMNSAFSNQTATLLNNGTVLVAGGEGSTHSVASAELYDLATGTFTSTGSMNFPRANHTATLLNDGMVLIAGGVDDSIGGLGLLASAELYDPATGIFTLTGSMNTARDFHTATLLKDGTVLVAAGVGGVVGVLASAELYDPAMKTFSLTGNMSTGRDGHTATLLNDGTVLVAGGVGPVGIVQPTFDSAELYDPTMKTFSLTGNMSTGRNGHTATLLNDGTVLVAGGDANGLAKAELYDPTTKTFNLTGSMNTDRFGPTAMRLTNGTVLVAGGRGNGGGSSLASAELYEPTTGTFTLTGSMNTGRLGPTATRLTNGTVLVAGGLPGTPGIAELYELVVVSPASFSFSDQAVGTTSASETVTLTNNGPTALGITSVTTSGTNASDFGVPSSNCVGSVAAGASCSINVTFTPAAIGRRTGSLSIANNLSVSPLVVALSGTGQDFSLAPVSSASATVTAGQTANFTVSVSSSGGFNQSVAFACTGAPSQSTCTVSPSSITLNGSAATSVAVTVTTMAASLGMTTPSTRIGYPPFYLITELLLLLLLLMGLLGWHRGRRPSWAYGFALLLFVGAGLMSACGGGSGGNVGNQGTPAGTYTLVVSATFTSGSVSLTHKVNFHLVVK